LMWNERLKFYCDLTLDGNQVLVKTIAAYWTLLAGVAGADRIQWMVSELENPATFWRLHPVPTCAADEPAYLSDGGYWRGAVWAPTNTMVIRGLERVGNKRLAATIARKHVEVVAKVFKASGTIWESYAPDAEKPARTAAKKLVQRDFVGWSGIGPIMYFLEYVIGLRAHAPANTLDWTISSPSRSGCERYRFNGHVTSLLAWPEESRGRVRVQVDTDGDYLLKLSYGEWRREYFVKKGKNRLILGSGK
jgi:glycogen debranching enzyme